MKRVFAVNNGSSYGSQEEVTNSTFLKSSDVAENSVDDVARSKRCFSLGECEQCEQHVTKVKETTIEGCNKTGRREKFECVVLEEGVCLC